MKLYFLMGLLTGISLTLISLSMYSAWRGKQDRKKGKIGLESTAPFLAGEPLKMGDIVHVSPRDGRVYRGYGDDLARAFHSDRNVGS